MINLWDEMLAGGSNGELWIFYTPLATNLMNAITEMSNRASQYNVDQILNLHHTEVDVKKKKNILKLCWCNHYFMLSIGIPSYLHQKYNLSLQYQLHWDCWKYSLDIPNNIHTYQKTYALNKVVRMVGLYTSSILFRSQYKLLQRSLAHGLDHGKSFGILFWHLSWSFLFQRLVST